MRKKLSIALISSVALLFATGCSSKQDVISAEKAGNAPSVVQENLSTIYIDHKDASSVFAIAEEVGEKNAWKMTKIKSNEIFAEKIINDKTVFVSIKYFKDHLVFSNASQAKNLVEAVKKELASKKSSH